MSQTKNAMMKFDVQFLGSTDISSITRTLQSRIARNCTLFEKQFPNYGEGKQYVLRDNVNWLAGFWPGLLWLCAVRLDDPFYRATAESLFPSFVSRLDQQIDISHDLGFLYLLSARAQWQVTGDVVAKQLALRAANDLVKRFREPGQYIQAWGAVGDPDNGGRIIADTMMNLPLLFWASEQTGDERFRQVAYRHAQISQNYLVRPDGSSYHTFFFNQETGEPDRAETHQGFSDDSLWARGQAWMIYGYALAAQWCDEPSFLDTSRQLAERFLAELPADHVPYWDLRLPQDEEPLRDSSAGAIAACGMLRIAQLSGEDRYLEQATVQIQALLDSCLERDEAGEGLLKHGALHVPEGLTPDDYLIFGDYFFLEALMTLGGGSPDFWGPAEI